MTSILSLLSTVSPDLRPSRDEVEYYARTIAKHEGGPRKALVRYRHEAELQLWVSRWTARQEAESEAADSGVPSLGHKHMTELVA